MRMDLDFDPVGVVLTAQAGGGVSPPPAWVRDKNTPALWGRFIGERLRHGNLQ